MSAIAQKLESIVGSEHMHSWDGLNQVTQTKIMAAVCPTSQIVGIVYPGTIAELAEVITCADYHQWGILLAGGLSKLSWGGLAQGVAVVVSTARLNRLIDHAVGDLTVTAEAGTRLSDLQAILEKEGQFLAIDPAYAAIATLGGIVATADTGAWRHRYGGIRDMLIGVSMVRSDGQIAKAGGRVVKNVAGYDLMKLLTGSYGTLGIIGQVTFRVYPLPPVSRTVGLTGTAEQIAQVTQTLLVSALTPSAIELISAPTMAALGMGDNLGLLVRFQSIAVSVEQQATHLLTIAQALDLEEVPYSELEQVTLWQRLKEQLEYTPTEPTITCKIGVLPSNAVHTLEALSTLLPGAMQQIHAGSGLGTLRFRSEAIQPQMLLNLRQLCEAQGGFLTVLEAPVSLKEQFDLWGYKGNAFHLMQAIKKQFDPKNLLNPHRFVGGI